MTENLYDLTEYRLGYDPGDAYTPTTEVVRATYACDYYVTEVGGLDNADDRAAYFDRWLDTIKADVWQEAIDSVRTEYDAELTRLRESHDPPQANPMLGNYLGGIKVALHTLIEGGPADE